MNRAEFRRLAEVRLREAEALLAAGLCDGAHYLAGYAVECGLKACVLKRIAAAPELLYSSRRFGDECWTHNLLDLLEKAGLGAALDVATATNPRLKSNWQTVRGWKEDSRYKFWTPPVADALVRAVGDQQDGVLEWVKPHW